jgi:hypothetical protein
LYFILGLHRLLGDDEVTISNYGTKAAIRLLLAIMDTELKSLFDDSLQKDIGNSMVFSIKGSHRLTSVDPVPFSVHMHRCMSSPPSPSPAAAAAAAAMATGPIIPEAGDVNVPFQSAKRA